MSRRGALKGAAELWEASFAITGDLSELTPAALRYVLRGLTDGQKAELATRWSGFERKGQREPPGDWRVWLIQAGRGFRNPRAGAEWVRQLTRDLPAARGARAGGPRDEGGGG